MFTPQEVSEKAFPKTSGLSGGYQMTAVDEFLDRLTEDYTALFKENVTLKAKLKVLAEKVEEYRSTEDSMRAALLTAQKMATKLVQEAQTEHDNLMASAREDAQAEQERLKEETRAVEEKLRMAQEKTAEFICRSRELCKQQSEFLAQLPEMEVPAAEISAEQQDAVDAIGKDILDTFDAIPEDVPSQLLEEKDEPVVETEDTIDMTQVFKLEDLQFGRNYGSKE